MTMKRFVGACLAALGLTLGASGGAMAQSKEVRVYNWSDYIDEQTLKDFEAETGIKVTYDVFDQNEILETKLLAGKSGYDVVVPSATFLSRQIKAGVFQKLDKDKIPNLQYAWPEIYDRLATYDPGNAYAVNYMWGTTGIGYNVAKVKKALGADVALDSWALVYDPENLKKLKGCGVMFLDSAEDLLPSVMTYLGLKPEWTEDNITKAAAHLAKLKPYVTQYNSTEYISALAKGSVCVAVGYSGDVYQAKTRAEEAKSKAEVDYILPKEGAQLWFDEMAIPTDAPHPDAALAFINYMQRPEVAAKNSNFVAYANGNLKSQDSIDAGVKGNPNIYPTPEVFGRLFTVQTITDSKLQKTLTRAFQKAKAGRT